MGAQEIEDERLSGEEDECCSERSDEEISDTGYHSPASRVSKSTKTSATSRTTARSLRRRRRPGKKARRKRDQSGRFIKKPEQTPPSLTRIDSETPSGDTSGGGGEGGGRAGNLLQQITRFRVLEPR